MRQPSTPSELWLRWLAFFHVPLMFSVAVAQMPYNPTRILQQDNLLYVFQPSPKTPSQFQLSSIDISSRIEAARLPYTTLYPTLPFLDNDTPRAFTPVLDDQGNITVYAGDCSEGASGGEIWNLTPSLSAARGKSDWKQMKISVGNKAQSSTVGPNFLNAGMSFSSIVGGDAAGTNAYFFGGMCPSSNATIDDWQSAANYSNSMVALEAPGSHSVTYQLDVSTSRGPPVPEAGFTLTSLSPTFSNRSDGTQTQQQNFVLVGGHASAAFINMSQVALFSLPEQSWTFIGIKEPDTTRTDLAIRTDVASVDPRSGHSAMLTPDGKRIIVFGGWVGDVNTPAEPQLAVLNIADGYGGDGGWQWTVPSTSGGGLPANSGLYGHGAAMLPGGVMMITGGYSIPSSSRLTRSTTSNTAYFFNTTSNTWTTDYSPPSEKSSGNNGFLSTQAQKTGLGIGLGIGLAALCGLFALYMWYSKRWKRQREIREKQLQDLSFTTHRYNVDEFSSSFDGRGGRPDGVGAFAGQDGSYYFPSGTQGGPGWRQSNGQDVERSGLLVEIPSPTRGLRRSLSRRISHTAGAARGPGHIHSIQELEEEQDNEQANQNVPLIGQLEMTERRAEPGGSILDQAPVLDPFNDPHRYGEDPKSAFCSPSSSPVRAERGRLNQDGVIPAERSTIVATATHSSNPNSTGRLSPDKLPSERTGSNLSEKSIRSNLSWTSSHGGLLRNSSLRSATLLNAAAQADPYRSPDLNLTGERPRSHGHSGRQSPEEARTQSLTAMRNTGHGDIDLFRAAQTSFALLQAEGEALLGGKPDHEHTRPDTSPSMFNTYRDNEGSNSRPLTSVAVELSRNGPRAPNKSWLGTVRRVLKRSLSSAERTRPLRRSMPYQEPYTDNPLPNMELTTSNEPQSFPSVSVPPRRAASDASFWRNKRGKQDWIDDESDPKWRRNSGDDWGAPEDIALAERERMRQTWRERGNLLIADDEEMPTPRTPIRSEQLGIPSLSLDDRPPTPAGEGDWDVEAAVERRVVQVMFTVPKSKLRVVNADTDSTSMLSVAREGESENSSRVKEMAGRFEQLHKSSPSLRPSPSPSPSIRSLKVRGRVSQASLGRERAVRRQRNDD
ncbi:hypothetical protein P153DRAFT_368750 [Dothidotthia symphoricarpi CBS 119687]|uniref:Galactose oxidase n=1 Tax=Dothidotthia symphoricarpi CBS 119687 TaxID=1392245 RepID=A0A6A6A6M1_9PLEO|nr:uncharacterized protein P153DRAFT_368750 [Dothidotthia symphoricarpi CBS 119687]KAF2127460.1 hypothetical protein P153DRAFT_368750 [Dothidotthia symphoricarpi CBS 119687]